MYIPSSSEHPASNPGFSAPPIARLSSEPHDSLDCSRQYSQLEESCVGSSIVADSSSSAKDDLDEKGVIRGLVLAVTLDVELELKLLHGAR